MSGVQAGYPLKTPLHTLDHASLHPSLTDPGLTRAVGQFLRGTWPLKARLIREAMFKDGLHLLKSIFELPFPFD